MILIGILRVRTVFVRRTNSSQTQFSNCRSGTLLLQNERVGREKWIVMNNARNALGIQRNQCADLQRQLAEQKNPSNNNLAGAVRDVAISQEMTASAIACDSRSRAKEKQVADAEKICGDIKCIPAF